MIDNHNFNRLLEESGMSMYALAKRSAVPYTTINEIHRGKNDINQCAAGTVQRIAAALGTSAEEILNDIHYLDGVKGKYKGIEYVWSTEDCSQITFNYDGKEITLSDGKVYNIPSRIDYYNIIAGWMIKDYIAKEQWKKEALERIERLKNHE
ncbi:MAG: helix-turn-helix domain-containing protein [Firmicutes bacterium]|nr:helix-turn-helix domain-containing protein [Bacillota bacterium]